MLGAPTLTLGAPSTTNEVDASVIRTALDTYLRCSGPERRCSPERRRLAVHVKG